MDTFLSMEHSDSEWAAEYASHELATPRYIRLLWNVIGYFYEDLNQGAGGPLHIVTDDYNVEDSSLAHCRGSLADYDDVHHAAALILDMLAPLSIEDRGGVVRGAMCLGHDRCAEHSECKAVGYFLRKMSESAGYDSRGCKECCDRARHEDGFAFDSEVYAAFDESGARITA
jgi:hypothetical protein